MIIGFLGKGGSGKTTLSAAFTKHLSQQSSHVIAIDADVNMHLHQALDIPQPLKKIGDSYEELFEYLFRGRSNKSSLPKIGTIPPSHDSHIITSLNDAFLQSHSSVEKNIHLLEVGSFTDNQVGAWCFHGRLQALELFLHYSVLLPENPIVLDFNAGTDAISSSLYFTADLYIFVVEPTLKSVNVYKEYLDLVNHSQEAKNITIKVVVNKIYNESDKDFIHQHIKPEKIIGYIDYKASDIEIDDFTLNHKAILNRIEETALSSQNKADERLGMLQKHFSNKVGKDAQQYIDKEFSYEHVRHHVNEYFERCYLSPIDQHKKDVFKFLMSHIKGSVFEIGAGAMPWYWALGYIDTVDSVIFSEYSPELLDEHEAFMERIGIEEISPNIIDTVSYLKETEIVRKDKHPEDIFEEILTKSSCMQFDFLNPAIIKKKFDTVIGFEALEIVDDVEELITVLTTIYNLLDKSGTYVGTTYPYRKKSWFVQQLIDRRLEGRLNPNADTLRHAAREVGFREVDISEIKGRRDVYSDGLAIILKK